MLNQNTDIGSRLTRRHLVGMFLAGFTGAMGAACTTNSMERITSMRTDKQKNQDRQASTNGRLLARPTPPTGTAPVGLQPLGLSTKRDGLLYVPKNYQASRPAPLVVMLHGAGGDAHGGLTPFRNLADAAGLILLAPASRRETWDVLFGQYGPDITLIDQALAQTFSRYAVDPSRIAIEGFSDGASYALSVGIELKVDYLRPLHLPCLLVFRPYFEVEPIALFPTAAFVLPDGASLPLAASVALQSSLVGAATAG
jgi:hypothetical protein